MCASQNLGPYKEDVRRFWEAASCEAICAEGSSVQEKFASMPRRVIAWHLAFVTSHSLRKGAVKTSLRSASRWELITLNGRDSQVR
jgi:hypothetical protein